MAIKWRLMMSRDSYGKRRGGLDISHQIGHYVKYGAHHVVLLGESNKATSTRITPYWL